MKVFGVVGWKNSGKTCLIESLVEVISSRGFSVSTIKHAHHTFDIDQVGKDSYRHRKAGAKEVILSSGYTKTILLAEKAVPQLLEPSFSVNVFAVEALIFS